MFLIPGVIFSFSLLSSDPELIVWTSSLSESVITSCFFTKSGFMLLKTNAQKCTHIYIYNVSVCECVKKAQQTSWHLQDPEMEKRKKGLLMPCKTITLQNPREEEANNSWSGSSAFRLCFFFPIPVRDTTITQRVNAHTQFGLIKGDTCFAASLLTFFSPWLVSQEATLLFPVSSGINGGFSPSVPVADAFNPSLLSWLPEAGRGRMCKIPIEQTLKQWRKNVQIIIAHFL